MSTDKANVQYTVNLHIEKTIFLKSSELFKALENGEIENDGRTYGIKYANLQAPLQCTIDVFDITEHRKPKENK